MYSENTIALVKQTSMADTARKRMGNALKGKGAKMEACCPFHDEKTPSFTIDMNRNGFKCFGCNESGGVVDFVMKYDNVDFVKAVEILCEENAIVPEYENDGKSKEQRQQEKDEKTVLYEMMEYTCQVYEMNLTNEHRDMLYRRGVTDADIAAWRIGYAPAAWKTITAWAVNGGRLPMAIKLDLVREKNEPNGDVKYYDRWRNRIMLPICDEAGRVVGYGAWNAYQEEEEGKVIKYKNSSETPLYSKASVLYGMHAAKRTIVQTKSCGITEGYFDVISAHRQGLKEVVAPCGTSITPEQLKWLRAKNCERVRLMTDNDKAGTTAALRAIDMILEAGMVPEKAVWDKDCKDVDDLIKKIETFN